jgi:hypothetical protein
VDIFVAASNITIQEQRAADGLDAYVPVILRDGALYDPHLDRFFLDLPLNGVRSRHSLRAYGYDIVVWLRFLADALGKSVWEAGRDDVTAFHRARRRSDASKAADYLLAFQIDPPQSIAIDLAASERHAA